MLAAFFIGLQTARAAEPAAASPEAAAVAVATESRDLAAAGRERSSLSVSPEQVLPRDGPTGAAPDPARLDRPPVRVRRIVRRDDDRGSVRREEERPQARLRREAAAIPWHRAGNAMGMVLGVGF